MSEKNSIIGDGKSLYENIHSKMGGKTMDFLSDCHEKTKNKVFKRAMSYFTEIVEAGLDKEMIMEIVDGESQPEVVDDKLLEVFERMKTLARLT